MKVCAIIAEYNPLHNGHLYHIQKTKEKVHPDYLIVVMSGNFTQRGEPAIIDKWARTAWALSAGADLVIELPACYATGSANRFADGAMQIIRNLGVVTHLSFGSEADNLEQLLEVVTLRSSGTLDQNLFSYLKDGLTYAKAFEMAISDLSPDLDMKFFSQSNAILAMEYLYYLSGSDIAPVLIPRSPSPSHGNLSLVAPITSATSIRNALTLSMQDITGTVPSYVRIPYPVTLHHFDVPIRVQLQKLGAPGIGKLQDVSEGLENRIYLALQSSHSLHELLEKVKTKRYLYSRLQRILIYSLLGIEKDLYEIVDSPGVYARVLGFRKNSAALLDAMQQQASIPVLTKVSEYEKVLPQHLHPMLQKDILATNIYSTVAPIIGNSDFTHPIIIQ